MYHQDPHRNSAGASCRGQVRVPSWIRWRVLWQVLSPGAKSPGELLKLPLGRGVSRPRSQPALTAVFPRVIQQYPGPDPIRQCVCQSRHMTGSPTPAARATALLLPFALVGAFALSPSKAADAPSAPSGTRNAAIWGSPLGADPGAPLVISGPYRQPETPYTSGHRGVDFPASPGDPVVAPTGGTVSFVGRVVDRDVISIRVDARTVYSLEPIAAPAALEETVAAGSLIGVAGTGGHCETECVHLGVRVDEEYVSPLRYLLGKPILLPW